MGNENMVVLIIGASTGIGKACAEYLGGRGYRVYGTSRKASANPTPVGNYKMVKMDVGDDESVVLGIETVLRDAGHIDAVFNNAGLHAVGPIESLPMSEFEKTFQTNCLGPIRVCKAILPHFRARKSGHIINMSSLSGVLAVPYQAAYVGSKFALEGLSEVLRAEVRRFGIKVTVINPGDIRHQDTHSSLESAPDYEPWYSNAKKIAWADEEQGYPPEKIGPLVERIIQSRRPRLRYYFGQLMQSPFMALKRLLPEGLSEWLIAAYYKT